MTTELYPPPTKTLPSLIASANESETEWLLLHLSSQVPSLLSLLKDCLGRIESSANTDPYNLAMTSTRSETLKGIISRHGTQVTKMDIIARLKGLGTEQYNIKLTTDGNIVLTQLVDCAGFLRESIEILENLKFEYLHDVLRVSCIYL